MKNEKKVWTVTYQTISGKQGKRVIRYIEFSKCEKCGAIKEKRVK